MLRTSSMESLHQKLKPYKANSETTGSYPCVRGILCRLLFNMSSISTDVALIRRTRYRRSTMSPSLATNTSSPCERNTLFGSPGLFAKPKNFRRIGGGGGGVGGTYCPFALSVAPGAIGAGIGSAAAAKILRPLPLYFVSSLSFSKSSLSVGSNDGAAGTRVVLPLARLLVAKLAVLVRLDLLALPQTLSLRT